MKQFLCLALSMYLCASPQISLADVPPLEVSDSKPVHTSLEKLIGKPVILKLVNGEELSGIVKKVGPEAVHIAELSGREFFDALVPLQNVVALVVRTRSS